MEGVTRKELEFVLKFTSRKIEEIIMLRQKKSGEKLYPDSVDLIVDLILDPRVAEERRRLEGIYIQIREFMRD